MKKTTIITLAIVAIVFGTIMLAEPTSASPFFIIGKHHGFARRKHSNVAPKTQDVTNTAYDGDVADHAVLEQKNTKTVSTQ